MFEIHLPPAGYSQELQAILAFLGWQGKPCKVISKTQLCPSNHPTIIYNNTPIAGFFGLVSYFESQGLSSL